MKKYILLVVSLINLSGGCVLESVLTPFGGPPEIIIYDDDDPTFLEAFNTQAQIVNIDSAFIEKDILTLHVSLEQPNVSLKFKLATSETMNLSLPAKMGCFLIHTLKKTPNKQQPEKREVKFKLNPIKKRCGSGPVFLIISSRKAPPIEVEYNF